MDTLLILKKHIKHQASCSNVLLHNITDLNQSIGTLQTLDKYLKKCLEHLASSQSLQQLAQECQFMGENLIDRTFFIQSIQKEFHTEDIHVLSQYNSDKEIQALIKEKREEIAHLLDLIFTFLDQEESGHPNHLHSNNESSFSCKYFP